MLTRLPLALLAAAALASCSPPVEIVLDDHGVTHVYAATDADAWYGAGYQMAADRMFQMEMLRRFARGELSAVLGEEGLLRDKQARIFDFPRWGRLDRIATEEADPERAELISAWVAGINARIEEVAAGEVERPFGRRAAQHDFGPAPWTEDDPYIVLKGANFALDKTLEFEIAMTLVNTLYGDALAAVRPFQPAHSMWGVPPEDQPTQVASRGPAAAPGRDSAGLAPDAGDRAPWEAAVRRRDLLDWARPVGSNNWAVDGRHTATGTPLIAGDPHLGFDFFGAPYPLHVNSADKRGTYDVAGFAFPGTPGIALGHNAHVAWTCTSAFADTMDVWSVVRAGDGILWGDDVVPLTSRTEAITVRDPGGPADEGSTVAVIFEEVEGVGVLLPPELLPLPFGDYLVGWVGFDGRPLRWFWELNRVAGLGEFEAAVGRMEEMNYSFVAADAEGIAYRVGVSTPDRPHLDGRRAPWKAMDAADPTSLWTGDRLTPEQMPHGRAPDRGWIATANQDPFGFTDDGDITNDPWYYGAFFAPGYRAQRIGDELTRLTDAGDVTVEDMQALQMDTHSMLADVLVPMLGEATAANPTSAGVDALTAVLDGWDRRVVRDSTGALAFHAFARHVAAEALADDMALAWDFAMELKPLFMMKIATMALNGDFPDASPVLQGGRDAIVLAAAEATAAYLREEFGAVDSGYVWADRKVTSLDHAYGFGQPLFAVPTDGGEDTVNVGQDITFPDDGGPWVTSYVSVERTVARIGDDGVPDAWVQFPLAGPADPDSAATESSLEDYVEGTYRPLLFAREDVDAAAATTVEIERLGR